MAHSLASDGIPEGHVPEVRACMRASTTIGGVDEATSSRWNGAWAQQKNDLAAQGRGREDSRSNCDDGNELEAVVGRPWVRVLITTSALMVGVACDHRGAHRQALSAPPKAQDDETRAAEAESGTPAGPTDPVPGLIIDCNQHKAASCIALAQRAKKNPTKYKILKFGCLFGADDEPCRLAADLFLRAKLELWGDDTDNVFLRACKSGLLAACSPVAERLNELHDARAIEAWGVACEAVTRGAGIGPAAAPSSASSGAPHTPASPAVASLDAWLGDWRFSEVCGRTAGGTGIVVEYLLAVGKDGPGQYSPRFSESGYQASSVASATLRGDGNRLEVVLDRTLEGLDVPPGVMFTLEHDNGLVVTDWGSLVTNCSKGPKTVRFTRNVDACLQVALRDSGQAGFRAAAAACEGGDPRGCGLLADKLDAGTGGVKDGPRAHKLREQACDSRWGPACTKLGLEQKGCEAGDTSACDALCRRGNVAACDGASEDVKQERATAVARAQAEQRLPGLFAKCTANRAIIEHWRMAGLAAERAGDEAGAQRATDEIDKVGPAWSETLSKIREAITLLTGDQGPRFTQLVSRFHAECDCKPTYSGRCR